MLLRYIKFNKNQLSANPFLTLISLDAISRSTSQIWSVPHCLKYLTYIENLKEDFKIKLKLKEQKKIREKKIDETYLSKSTTWTKLIQNGACTIFTVILSVNSLVRSSKSHWCFKICVFLWIKINEKYGLSMNILKNKCEWKF